MLVSYCLIEQFFKRHYPRPAGLMLEKCQINLVFRSICTTFELTLEDTHARENSKKFWFSSRLFVPLQHGDGNE